MVNYSNGKIYKIVDFTNDNFYVGSTTQERLCSRLGEHVSDLKSYMRGKRPYYCASMEITINENYKIFLLDIYPCNSKDELTMKEQEWMDKLRCDKMVNKQNAYVSKENLLIKKKKYREDHKEELSIKKKEYRKDNLELVLEQERASYQRHKEQRLEQQRQFRKDNPELSKERYKSNYLKNKEKILAKKKQKIECPNCKKNVRIGDIARHKKSQRCLDFVEK